MNHMAKELGDRYRERREKLKEVAKDVVANPRYKRGWKRWPNGKEKTYCNIALWDAACRVEWWKEDDDVFDHYIGTLNDVFNYDLSPMFQGRSILSTPIPVAYDNCVDAASKGLIREHTPLQAHEYAFLGSLIMGICKKKGMAHVVGIWPDEGTYDYEKGPKIFQAGWWNVFDVHISDPQCFGTRWRKLGIRFFEFKDRITGGFLNV